MTRPKTTSTSDTVTVAWRDWLPADGPTAAVAQMTQGATMSRLIGTGLSRQSQRILNDHDARIERNLGAWREAIEALVASRDSVGLARAYGDWLLDATQRMVLTMDALRQRGDIFIAHEAADCPPVLIYDYEIVMDGADLSWPCNYFLMRIQPPDGGAVHDWKRPYVIIDPRAGHGAGIGGFKSDSQVGVALRDGHPVYFVGFRRMPEPGQTLAHVTQAEAAFVREVERRHPEAPKPVVTGNCQGGWAALILAASNPDLTGPLLLNGAPVDTWAGSVGENPMRYNGGLLGGVVHPMLLSDLGNGKFDGAHIVANFEQLNPARNYFGKYYDLYAGVDEGVARFLEFERWWGGLFLLNEPEMRWIVEQLFVGNRLVKNEAQLEPGRNIDVKAIRSPIIVFASEGDNITPPQQALNWILRSYADEREIEIRGQRIVYMIHDQIGHLGIFVSSRIARKEHSEVVSTLKTIESLPPGLYEMKIDDYEGEGADRTFTVSFHDRRFEDLRGIDDGTLDEEAFAGVARLSEQVGEAYDLTLRPLVRSLVTEAGAEMARKVHPLRVQRAVLSSANPVVAPLERMAENVRAARSPLPASNPFWQMQACWADAVVQSMDMWRDTRDMLYEARFFQLWANPLARWYGSSHRYDRALESVDELRAQPQVQAMLARLGEGGFVEAVIRMLVLLADSRGSVRRDRLERSAQVLMQDAPFSALGADERARILHEQTIIVQFERDAAIETLPTLLSGAEERLLAAEVVQYIPGALEEMDPRTLSLLQRFRQVLDLPPATGDVTEDPLGAGARTAAQ